MTFEASSAERGSTTGGRHLAVAGEGVGLEDAALVLALHAAFGWRAAARAAAISAHRRDDRPKPVVAPAAPAYTGLCLRPETLEAAIPGSATDRAASWATLPVRAR